MNMATNTTALSPPQPFNGQRVLRISGLTDSTASGSAGPGGRRIAPAHRNGPQHQWTHEENRDVMRAYYKSSPTRTGYRKRMLAAWMEDHPDKTMSEQRLAGQRRVIGLHKLLSTEEMELIKREMTGAETAESTEHAAAAIDEMDTEETMATDAVGDEEIGQLGKQILDNIVPVETRERLPPLKGMDKQKLRNLIEEANHEIRKMDIPSLTALNDIAYATAYTISTEMGVKVGNRPPTSTPPWKIRLQRKIEKLRRDLSQVESWKAGKLMNEDVKRRLEVAYRISEKGMLVVAEELKQRVVATATKLQRFDRRRDQYRQNRQFQFNQKRLYADLQGEEQSQPPNPDAAVKFWSELWGNKVDHMKSAKWIAETKKETSRIEEQPMIELSAENVGRNARRMKNWKAPGPDQVHGFWLKKLTSLHGPLAQLYQKSLVDGCPAWMTKGRTVLLQKDKAKGTAVDNYRPITCLPTMWKLLSGIIGEEIQRHLTSKGLIPREQKGCTANCRGTKDQLLTDKAVVKNCKRRKTNLEMVWIDYKKAYDRVPHSWLVECMDIYKVHPTVKQFLKNEMQKWTTELTSCGEVLGKVPIRRGIFQGDALSPLLFIMAMAPISSRLNRMKKGYEMEKGEGMISHLLYMDDIKLYSKTEEGMKSMVNTLKMISEDFGMEFGLDKCAKVSLKRGKISEGGDLPLYDGTLIKELDEDRGYKYLGILQSDVNNKEKAKDIATKEYYRRIRLIMKSELNAGNSIRAINIWAIPVVRYTAGIVDWTVADLQEADRKTRKLLTMHGAFNLNGDVDRLYIDRKNGGKGLLQVEQVIREEESALAEYVGLKKSEDPLLRAVATERIAITKESKAEYRKRVTDERQQNYRTKRMHGQFLRQTEDLIDQKESMRWIEEGYMKRGTENLLMAAQEQSLRTRKTRHAIDKANVDPKCRLCAVKDETVDHLVAGCVKLAQGEYKARHDKVASVVHWRLCKKYGIEVHKDWYKHEIQPVLETDKVKILWDMCIQTDIVIQARRPDIVVVDKTKKEILIIDIAVPADANVGVKEQEKITKYLDLKMELKRLWRMKARVIPVVVGALGSIPKDLRHWLTELGLEDVDCGALQKAALLGTTRLLRRTLVL
jgi:hypothetical protein